MYVGNVGMYTPASADTLEIYSAIKRNEIVTFAKKKMQETENEVKQHKPASQKQVSNRDFHVWTLGKKKYTEVKELLLETWKGKEKEHKWQE